ncbi:MAG: ABC transporter substrate-binding protein [Phycisphaerales bacterium]|nr:ABC transporter substrate-binding protein [Phycisphaerales bacterium]
MSSVLVLVCLLMLGGIGSFVAFQLSSDANPLQPAAIMADGLDMESSEAVSQLDEVRIATLLPFAADQLIQMGVRPVCIPGLRGRAPEAWEGIPSVQLDHSAGPNLEQLLAVEPDFIITGSTYAQFMPHIAEVTQAEVIIMDVETVDSVMVHIRTLGRISEHEMQAEVLAVALEERLKAQTDGYEAIDPINVLAIFGTPHSFYSFMPESYLGDLVRYAGGRMGPEGLTSHKIYRGLAPLTMETVIEFDPDLLLVLFHGPEETSRAMFEGDPLWGSLRAVHEGRIHFLADDMYAMRPGSQVDLAMEQIRGHVQSVAAVGQ